MRFNTIKSTSNYEANHPPDFMTHLNYVSCSNSITEGLSVDCNVNLKQKVSESKNLAKKLNLIKLTWDSLNKEFEIILKNPDYAELCVPWVAVKAYYLLFNLLLIIKYLLTSSESSFISSHDRILKDMKEFIKKGDLCFNKSLVNNIYKAMEVQNFKFKSGDNIRTSTVDLEIRFQQILKKLLMYKIEDFQRKNNIKTFRKKKDKEAKNDFLKNSDINICEFFYWYRIKANYRDLEFLDKDISSDQFMDFYKKYFELTGNFYKAFSELINVLSTKRLGRKII